MENNRRELMAMMALAGGGAALTSAPALAGPTAPALFPPTPGPTRALVPDGRLTVNRERAYQLMKQAGVDAIIGAFDPNARYLTNMRSVTTDMGLMHRIIGIMPADQKRPITAVMPALDIARHSSKSREWPEIITYSAPIKSELFRGMAALPITELIEAVPGKIWPKSTTGTLTPIEAGWERNAAQLVEAHCATVELGVKKALAELGLTKATIAVDDPAFAARLERAGLDGIKIVPGENLFLNIRLAKSAVEIDRMRIVSTLNDTAGRAMMGQLVPGMTIEDVQALFFAEVVKRGGRPEFIVAGMTSGLRNGRLVKHEPFMVDCCGNFDGYSGDFARTVVLGTPPNLLIERSKLLGKIAAEMTGMLKPGIRYSEITTRGREMARKMGADFPIGFGPHSVGLTHSDDPVREDMPFESRLDVTLVPGMVITVDLPTLERGWGSMHLENLILITADGAEWLGRFDDPLYEVRV